MYFINISIDTAHRPTKQAHPLIYTKSQSYDLSNIHSVSIIHSFFSDCKRMRICVCACIYVHVHVCIRVCINSGGKDARGPSE